MALFIYYKVDPACAEAFEIAARQMQATLKQTHAGLKARLWIRTDPHGSGQTWMETYEHPQGVTQAVAGMIEQLAQALPDGQMSPRHSEMFNPID